MRDRKDYWSKICAPKLRARKQELGRAVPERAIAAAVETATGKPSQRSLVGMWLHGEREPFISQFFALCEFLKLNPADVLETGALAHTFQAPSIGTRTKVVQYKKGRLQNADWHRVGSVRVFSQGGEGNAAGISGKRTRGRSRKGT